MISDLFNPSVFTLCSLCSLWLISPSRIRSIFPPEALQRRVNGSAYDCCVQKLRFCPSGTTHSLGVHCIHSNHYLLHTEASPLPFGYNTHFVCIVSETSSGGRFSIFHFPLHFSGAFSLFHHRTRRFSPN